MRRAILLAALGILALAFFAVAPKATGGPPLRDFESYYAGGATARLDGDPYGREVWRVEKDVPGVVASRDELLPFVGPPFGLPLWSLLAGLAWPNAVVVWDAVMALSLATLAFGALALAGGPITLEDAVAVPILVAGFGPLTSGVALGQSAVLSCAAIVAALLFLRHRALLGAAAAALVAALQPNLALVLGARLGDRRSAIALGGAAALVAAGSALELGRGGLGRYLATLAQHAAAERFIAIQTTPGAVARALGASPALAGTLALGLAALALLLVTLQCATRRYDPVARVAVASAALPLALPFAHEHDFAVAFLPAVLCLRASSGARWQAAAFATLAAGVDWLGLAQRPSGVAATALLTLAAALALAVLARGRLRPFHFAPAAT
ncbi:MAG: glycosyltransferase 87 family protein, partial [Candidatus Baltobacteraceae bacterium]